MNTYIALLRGINVGGKNKLPMKDLVGLFEGAGCANVRTYIQSGNVVFQTGNALRRQVPETIPRAIEARFGYNVPVVIRAAAELATIVANNPYTAADVDERFLQVGFLADTPSDEAVATLEPDRFTPDVFTVAGSEIYLCYPNGLARSKLTNAYFDRRLGTITTMRNWRTTNRLLEMSRD